MNMDACILIGLVVVIVTLYTLKTLRDRTRNYRQTSARVKKAIDSITADGIVEVPKGPYVPHRKWNVGAARGASHTGMPGYYGSTG